MQSGKRASGSFRSSFQEEARRRYRKRMQEEYEEELERVVRSSSIVFEYRESLAKLLVMPNGFFLCLLDQLST